MIQGNERTKYRLSDGRRMQFVRDGFLRIENAFSLETAADARAILWEKMGCNPKERKTWTRPVVWIGDCAQEPFRKAASSDVLHAACNELVGEGRWLPRVSLGSFPIRFPHSIDSGGTGWHVDASFQPTEPTDSYLDWRINVRSKGRALLMLFLFSDVGEQDAPTRIRVGSHLKIPELLVAAREDGMPAMELGPLAERATEGMPEAQATGAAGTVYLCHPFLVHAAQRHSGLAPRFLAQPPLYPREPIEIERADGSYSLVEKAIRIGLGLEQLERLPIIDSR